MTISISYMAGYRMDLNASHMFVAVVQAGSLSAAATRLGIPLPTLSRRIRDLERQLKVQLLERSARGTKLTDAGTRLYEHASRGIEALLDAEQAVLSDQARLKGRLRLSLPPTFEPWWDLLAAFQRRYPDIQVYVYSTERRMDLIEDGIDVALRVGGIVHEAMVAQTFCPFAMFSSPVQSWWSASAFRPSLMHFAASHVRCGRRASMFRPDGNWPGTWSSPRRCCPPTTIITCAAVRSVAT
jgi:DNA-binding transcriptional LysR family regulator